MKLNRRSAWQRLVRVSRSLAALMLLAILGTEMVWAQSPGTFTVTGDMTTARNGHTATLLNNGKVLITGGSTAELYDPSTGIFTATGNMTAPRGGHTATLLPNGKVLISGGSTAELYEPSTGTFTATGNLTTPRSGHTATLLADGRVLVAGGWDPNARFFGLASAELYDLSTGTFAATGNMTAARYQQTATLLADGTVLFAVPTPEWWFVSPHQEFLAAGELYDPSTGTFNYKGAMPPGYGAYGHTASLLMNGTVLITGGGDADVGGATAGAELYDPASGTFAAGVSMGRCRFSHMATMLPGGTVLITGGDGRYCDDIFSSLGSAELYDPSRKAFAATGNMTTFRQGHRATLLNDGKVLITGGFNFRYGAGYVYHASAELYHPAVLAPPPRLFSLSLDGRGQGAILHPGTPQVASSSNPAYVGEALEIYCTGLVDGSVIPPQVTIGGRMANLLFFGNAPGFLGLNQVNVRVPSGVAPGPAVPVRLTYLGRTSNEVTIAVR